MTFKSSRLCLLLWPLSVAPAYSAAIQNLTFTDVVKDVTVINVATKQETPAKAGDVLVPPNVLKTGPDSRAELVAEDKTVTRVGANTIFSVEADSRDVNIAQGSVLFNSPKGKGGGRIKSAGATASVLGTTLIVGANQDGGFKVMLLEGKGEVKGAKGGGAKLSPGQLSFAMPGKPPTAPLNFQLKGSVANSKLVGGFSKPLASMAKIEAAVKVQQAKIDKGELLATGVAIGDRPGVGIVIDASILNSVRTQQEKYVAALIQSRVDAVPVKPETVTPSSNSIDPRYILAVAANLNLTSSISPPEAIFSVDGTGVSREGWRMVRSVPQGEPQSDNNADISMLIAKNIELKLNVLEGGQTDTFLHSPADGKDTNALVALQNLKISSDVNLDFSSLRTTPNLSGVSLVEGQATIHLPSALGLEPGFAVTGNGLAEGSYVSSVDYTNNTITLNKAPTETLSGVTLFGLVEVDAVKDSNKVTVSLKQTAAGNATLDPFAGLRVGMPVNSSSFPTGTVIQSIAEDGVITLSKPALSSGMADLALGGVPRSTPLILSAGRTIIMEPGSLLRTSTSLLDIYAAGTEFAEDVTLAVKVAETKVPLVLDRVSIDHYWLVPEAIGDSSMSIKAPQINILDSRIFEQNSIKMEAFAGDITISSRDVKGTVATVGDVSKITLSPGSDMTGINVGQRIAGPGIPEGTTITAIADREITLSAAATETSSVPVRVVSPVPLGIASIDELAICSRVLSLKASGNISISNVPLYTVDATFEAQQSISLSGIDLRLQGSALPESMTLAMTATNGVVTIDSTLAPELMTTALRAKTGKVTVTDSEFGRAVTEEEILARLSDTPRTSFQILADKAEIILKSLQNEKTSIYADAITLSSKGDLSILGAVKDDAGTGRDARITLSPTDALGALNLTSKTGAVNILNTQIKHFEVAITAGGELMDATASRGPEPTATQALNEITLNKVAFTPLQSSDPSKAARIAIDATTVVLKDVSFPDGSNVFLNSFHGKVAAYPGQMTEMNIERKAGYVNFMSNVKYGDTVIKFAAPGGSTVEKARTTMDNAAFQAAAAQAREAGAAIGDLSKIRIGTQTGNAKAVMAAPSAKAGK